VRFVVKNSGAVKHELVLGTPEELKEHYALMLKMPGMEHADDNMVSVAPGQTGESRLALHPAPARWTLPACNPATMTPA
jgi:uncharacterized cupredoxin-like copper-binding protein